LCRLPDSAGAASNEHQPASTILVRRLVENSHMQMRTCRISMLLAMAALCAGPARAADVLYVKAAHLIVDASQAPISPGAIVITDGIITAAGGSVTPPPGARQIDLGGLTIMPSLIDAHTHLAGGAPTPQPGQPTPLATPAYAALRAQKSVASALTLGVAAMRVLGTNDFLDVAIRNAIDDGVIPGPHLIPAAHPLSISDGHDDFAPLPYTMDVRDLYTPLHGYVSSAADAEKAAQLQIKFGARVIKLMASGGVGSPLDSPGDENLTLDEMRAAVQQAHMHHLKAAAHAESLQAIMDAMRAGVDSIEHGSDLNQEALEYMKSHNIVLVPTVHVAIATANETRRAAPGTFGASAYSQFKAKALMAKHEASFALALKSGVTMAAGSDNAYTPGSTGILAELVSDVEHGMSPRQALVSATLHGAALLGFDTLGTLASGMEGDFIATDGDPLTDIHAIERVRLVVFKGKIISDKTKPVS
jgi:imidazolonepropionase-like amidohydrolase